MTDVAVPAYHLGQIRGFLLAHNAPQTLYDSLDGLYSASIKAGGMATEIAEIHSILDKMQGLPTVTIAPKAPAVIEPKEPILERVLTAECHAAVDSITDEQKIALHIEEKGITKPKRTSNMSPENRAAAGRRMKKMVGWRNYVKHCEENNLDLQDEAQWKEQWERNNPQSDAAEAVSAVPAKKPDPQPFKEVPADKLISDHNEYIGKREDNTLAESDWPDVQRMRYNGLPDQRIANHYDVELEYLQKFVAQQEKKEEAKTGNY